jgi:eukaryotic-like serine/threonine-protein kinase
VTPELREQLQASLGDSYVIERELAPGGMSRLFLATEASLDRQVVIKLLPPDAASDVSAARFQREVLLAARLQHPHILPVLTSGTSAGLFYYIMPFVAGESLRQRLERGDRFAVPDALRILREIADALALAHDRGIVHRDIKPANILLQEGHAVVTDFGIARAVEASRVDSPDRLTATGVGIGTLGYMAPEQLAGEKDLDASADVYALAVVGYEMLAGKPPFSRPTAQALVAAHMTEPPPPLESVAPEVPHEISAVIAKALSKTPSERYHSASEFRDALDLHMTATYRAGARRPSRRVALIGGVAVAVVALAGLFAANRGPALDPNYVVILPFNVRNADTTLREGMVDVLSDGINGQGWVRTVAPSRYIRDFRSGADQATAAQLGKRMGAALAIYGTVDAIGKDSLQVTARVIDVGHRRQLGVSVARAGAKQNLPRLASDLARAVLKELNNWKPVAAFRTSWIEETNLPALQAFLVAEQFYRRSAWDSAMAYYARAIDADSAFALANRHAGLVVGWRRSNTDSIARAYLRAAGRYNRGLPRRDSLLVVADSVRSTLALFETDTAYFASIRRLVSTLQTARDSFPNDPEVWYALGDAYFHYSAGAQLSVAEDTILAAFDHSIQLDSGFTPAYIHAIELALTREGSAGGLRYADRYLALGPAELDADGVRVLALLLREGRISSREAKILDTLSEDSFETAWLIARRSTDSGEVAVRLLQLRMNRSEGARALTTNPGIRRMLLVEELAYRGHLKEASTLLGTNIGPLEASAFGTLAALGGVSSDSAAAVFARLLHDPSGWVGYALPWWATHGDTSSLIAAAARADSQFQRATTPVARRNWAYRVAASRAYVSLGRHSSDALARFRQIPDSSCLACFLDRLTKARLLDSLGQHAEAEGVLSERPYLLLTPLEITAALQRAMIAERLQHYEIASRDYGIVARAWQGGDPAEREHASTATAKFEQLGGDQRRSIAVTPVHR